MKKWKSGHIEPFWPQEFKSFPYVVQPVTYEETTVWEQMGYDYVKSFTGMMYDNRNPMPNWVSKFAQHFTEFKDLTYTFYKMRTLDIMPPHADHYRTYCKLFNADYLNVCRILVMMEDWKPGHYLEVDSVGIINWKAGDYYIWENNCSHAAANIGVDDRYTLQITGTKIC